MKLLQILTVSFLLLIQMSVFAYLAPEKVLSGPNPTKVLVFLSHLCPCSDSHIQHLNELSAKHPKVDFFAVISEPRTGEEKKDSKEYFSSKRFKFSIVDDPNQELVKKYNALKTPHVTMVKKSEKGLKVIYQGGVTDSRHFTQDSVKYLAENLEQLQKGLKLKHSEGRSLGCYIKR